MKGELRLRWRMAAVAVGILSLARLAPAAEPPESAASPAPAGLQVLRDTCAGCHTQSSPDHFARISEIRKTPEGWLMTIFRMQHVHHVQLSDAQRDSLVRYLADTQGLAPAEAAPARYALERRPNAQDLVLPHELQTLCARCHSAARVALQRRDTDDWLKHVHWHLAQWPTIEYQQNARDRLWWDSASTEVPKQLGALFPFQTQAWDEWVQRPRNDLSGTWLVHGHEPGRGDFWGTATISRATDGDYTAVYSLDTSAGDHMAGDSKAIVYTGFEWRGTASLGGRDVREVFAATADGQSISGRWFEAQHTEIGADWSAERASAGRIAAIYPAAARLGTTVRLTVLGAGLGGKVDFGPGTKGRIVNKSPYATTIDVRIAKDAAPGYRSVSVGASRVEKKFALYDHVDRLEVSPAFGIARLGGGKIDAVAAQFEAVAFADNATADGAHEAVRLGTLPVSWTVEAYNADAATAQDAKFAGAIDGSGRFMPGMAGPNPARKFSGNNAGNLAINATLQGEAVAVSGKAHLIVTVQRWNTPPIY